MDYTLTRIDPDGENDRYPLQNRRSYPILWNNMFTAVFTWANSKMPCMTW